MQDLKDIWAIYISVELFNEEFGVDVSQKVRFIDCIVEMQMLVDQTNALAVFFFVNMETWKR